MKRFIQQLRFSRKINNLCDLATAVSFGMCFLSIPLFSFLDKLNFITWFFSLIFIAFALLSIFLYYGFRLNIISWCYLLFMVCAFVSCLLVKFDGFSFSTFLNTLFIFLTYTYCISAKHNIKRILFYAYVGIAIFSIIFLIQYRSDLVGLKFDRLGEKFGDVNDIAIISCIGFALAFYRLINSRKIYFFFLNLVACITTLIVSFSTGSKIALFLIFFSSIFIVVARFGKKRWYFSLVFAFSIVVLLVLILTIPSFETLKDRFLNMIYTLVGLQYKNKNPDTSSLMRGEMFMNGLSLFMRRPLFGNGVNGFRTFSCFEGWSHNHWSDSLANFGLIGTFLYHLPIIVFYLNIKSMPEKQDRVIFCMLMTLLLISSISVALFNEKFFSYTIGIVLSSIKIDNKRFSVCLFKPKMGF